MLSEELVLEEEELEELEMLEEETEELLEIEELLEELEVLLHPVREATTRRAAKMLFHVGFIVLFIGISLLIF